MSKKPSGNLAVTTDEIFLDIVEFSLDSNYRNILNESFEECIDDDEQKLFFDGREIIRDVMLAPPTEEDASISFLSGKIDELRYLKLSSFGHINELRDEVLIFLSDYRETLRERFECAEPQFVKESIIYSILDEKQITHFKRYVKRDPRRVMSLAKSFNNYYKALFFQACCMYNPGDAYFASSFGRSALKSDARELKEKALECVENFLHDNVNLKIYVDLALDLGDKKTIEKIRSLNWNFEDPFNASTFSMLARTLKDEELMLIALRIQGKHLAIFNNACTYGSLACILGHIPYIEKAIEALKKHYFLIGRLVKGGNMTYINDYFYVANTLIMLENKLDQHWNSKVIAKDVRNVFASLSPGLKRKMQSHLKAIDHSEAVAFLRSGDVDTTISLLSNGNDGSPKYPNDEHRMTTLKSAKKTAERRLKKRQKKKVERQKARRKMK